MSIIDAKGLGVPDKTGIGPNVDQTESQAISDGAIGQLRPVDNPLCEEMAIDGADLLDRILAYACRFIGYPSPMDSAAHILWIAHTHIMDAWFTTPRLAILSPEPGSGKSRVLEITGLFVPNPILSVSSTSAYILRKIADQVNRPTILYDEIDNVFGPNARGDSNLLATLNAGYRQGATTGRCETIKGQLVPVEYPTYAAVALSGLGNPPDTIMSRSIIMRMRKQPEGETVEPFDPYDHVAASEVLRDELEAWAASVADRAESYRPKLPNGIVNRNADIWKPIIAVADLAGGQWPDLARQAAIETVQLAKANNKPSLGVQLLTDIRDAFGNQDRLPSRELIDKLLDDEEAPWGDLGYYKKLDARILAKLLGEYGIRSSTIRMPNNSTPKGYKRSDFLDAWKCYLPRSETDATSATSATGDASPEKTGVSCVADGIPPPPCGGMDHSVAHPAS